MKKVILILLVTALLSGCGAAAGNPTPSDAEMSTRVAAILTQMPAPTSALEQLATLPAEVEAAPTLAVTVIANTPTAAPSETPTQAPTEPPLPTETLPPTEAPTITQTVPPSPTPPQGDPRVSLGAPTSTDAMDNAKAWGWPEGEDQFTKLEFVDGKLKFSARDDVSGWRLPAVPAATNFYIEMKVKAQECSGKDNYGIIFRVPVRTEADRGYLFGVSCDGQYTLWKWDGKAGTKGKRDTLVWWSKPRAEVKSALTAGPNQTNRLGVKVVGDKIRLYANGFLLHEMVDDSYPAGNFGIFIDRDATKDFSVLVDEMSYWLLN